MLSDNNGDSVHSHSNHNTNNCRSKDSSIEPKEFFDKEDETKDNEEVDQFDGDINNLTLKK